MGTVPDHKTFAMKDKVEREIDCFAAKGNPTTEDLNAVVVVAQIEAGLAAYRVKAANMSVKELQGEQHVSSRLAKHLAATGDPRPNQYCHAHAIVSGGHPQAVRLRAVIAWLKMRIDDPFNGCWLPQNTAALPLMPQRLRNAVPHSRIHRFNYYLWLNGRINLQRTPSFDSLARELRMIAQQLQGRTFPPAVMEQKGAGV